MAMFRRLPTLSPVAWTAVERVTQQILWLVLFAILAPILGPRPYGLFAIGSVFVGFCEFALMEGAIEALVTVDELDHMHTTTANLANGAISFGLSLLICALAPAIGSLFGDDEIKFIMWALSPMPVLSALSAVPVAVLRRSLHYKELAVRSILGLVIGGVIGIIAGLAGAGVWALTLQVLTQRFAEFVIVWIAAPVRMTFGWSRSHFRELSPVALNVLVARTMSVANGILPRIILGYTLGATELGLFTLANRFLEVIVQTAIVPRTSVGRIELRDSKYGSAEFERTFAMMTQSVSLLAFPILLGAAALTPDLFRLWLGESWQPGIVPAQLLLLSGLPLVLFYCIDSALLAANMSSTFKWLSTIQTVSIAVVVLGASFFGLDVVCIALAIRPWVILPFFRLTLQRKCHLSMYRVLRQPISCFVGAVIMAAILSLPFLRPAWFYQTFDFALLIVGGVAFYGLFLYSFSRNQLKAALAGVPLLRRAVER
jgi:O-antigen/teichoic acid export membrane protein